VLATGNEVGAERHRRAQRADDRCPSGQFLEEDPELQPGEAGTETDVGTAAAESDVVVRIAIDVETEGIIEDLLVPIGRDVPETDLVARPDLICRRP
jgi:hypothetical protein